jgi:hypothetical protein
MEDLTKELSPRASAEPAQAPTASVRHRLFQTRLWKIVHGEVGYGLPCVNNRGAEEINGNSLLTVADGSAQVDTHTIIGEFLNELQRYCRKEKKLAERMRILRVTRSGLITTAHKGAYLEAGEKCGHFLLYRRSA